MLPCGGRIHPAVGYLGRINGGRECYGLRRCFQGTPLYRVRLFRDFFSALPLVLGYCGGGVIPSGQVVYAVRLVQRCGCLL